MLRLPRSSAAFVSIACLVIPSVLVVAPDHALGAASVSFGQNLIQNPGAEGGPPGQTIPFWTATGPFAVDRYSDSSGDLSVTSPGPRDRGNNYFWGGHANTVSSGTQTINLSDLATDITSGGVEYQLSGWLGGYDSQNDNAVLDAAFLNAQGAVLTDAILNGPDANARGGTSELLYKHTEGYVPAGAAAVRITITMRRTDGSDNDGLGDNLSLVLTEPSSSAQPFTIEGIVTSTPVYGIGQKSHTVVVRNASVEWMDATHSQTANTRTDAAGIYDISSQTPFCTVSSGKGGPCANASPGAVGVVVSGVLRNTELPAVSRDSAGAQEVDLTAPPDAGHMYVTGDVAAPPEPPTQRPGLEVRITETDGSGRVTELGSTGVAHAYGAFEAISALPTNVRDKIQALLVENGVTVDAVPLTNLTTGSPQLVQPLQAVNPAHLAPFTVTGQVLSTPSFGIGGHPKSQPVAGASIQVDVAGAPASVVKTDGLGVFDVTFPSASSCPLDSSCRLGLQVNGTLYEIDRLRSFSSVPARASVLSFEGPAVNGDVY